METAMTGTAWMFLLGTFALVGYALWMGWMGIQAPHKAFREGGHAPGAAGSFRSPAGAAPSSRTGHPMGHVA